jgi:cold shock CspA family protein
MTATIAATTRFTGTIKFVNPKGGFGFIIPDELEHFAVDRRGRHDVYFHCSALPDVRGDGVRLRIAENAGVSFIMEIGPKGIPQGADIRRE